MNEVQNNSGPELKNQIPLRAAFLASKNTMSEYSVVLQRLLVGLSDASLCSVLVCPADCDVDSVTSPGVEIIRYPFLNLPLLGRYNRKILIEKLTKFKPTVLHCLSEDLAVLARRIARQLNIPYLLTINSLPKRFAQFSFSAKRLAKIIAPSQSLGAGISKMFPRFNNRIRQINIGTFASETTGCFSKTKNLSSIITACPSKESFNFSKVLGAVRHLAIDGYEFMLIIISNQRAEKHLRAIISALGLSQNIIIVPRIEPWRGLLAAADIFIQSWPSRSFNLMLLEAMSVGTVVASCKGGVDDLIIEGKTAVIFDPDDELSIYNCLRQLLNSRDKAKKIAKQAQQYVKENHTVSKMIEKLLQLYNEATQWYNNA